MKHLDSLPQFFVISEKEVDKIVCGWSLSSGTAFTEEQIESLVKTLSMELTELVVQKQQGRCGNPDCENCESPINQDAN